ncbi:MAG: flagellar basal-body rod protein FlgF [Chromatiales bacterium]|nr:flagellar basal-body rod protein FlgF [Chromatiales bacterium]
MDRMLYIAMTGASHALHRQTATSNNLANATTTGFRADLTQFRSMPVFGPGYPSRAYALAERPASDFTPGALQSTGRELDLAVEDEGWIAVQARDGTEAYTKAGDLRTTVNGQLVTGTGLPVLGNNGPIAIPPAQKMDIGRDGTISVVPLGAQPNEVAALDRIKLVRPPLDQLEKGSDGLMRLKSGETAEADANVKVISGALESSNVNPAHELVELINLARTFQMQIKTMQTADQNEEAITRTMRLSG